MAGCRSGPSLNEKRRAAAIKATRWKGGCGSGGFHAGQSFKPLKELPIERGELRLRWEVCFVQAAHVDGKKALGHKPQRVLLEVAQALYQQSAADHQTQGKADFADHQNIACDAVTNPALGAASGLAQKIARILVGYP